MLGSVLLTLAIAVPLASLAALKRGTKSDHAIRGFTTLGLGFPAFWLGIMLIIVFSAKLGIFPVSGYGDTFWSGCITWCCPASPSRSRCRRW